MKTVYRVKFCCYQYNGGGTITSGDKLLYKDFVKIEDATEFASKIKTLLPDINSNVPEGSRDFATENHYVWDGYVSKYVGVFKLTEDKCNL